MQRRRYLQATGAASLLSMAGCLGDDEMTGSAAGSTTRDESALTLATATTAYDSGLLDAVVPGFEETADATVKTLVRGTGGALRTARDGDCDAVLVHARPLEDEFLRAGHGINRRAVMVNDFLIVGPPDDPAGVGGAAPIEALRAVAAADATFLSRGDRSGTHVRERRLWERAGIDPSGDWYRETGQGMGDTLVLAARSGAYTLTDRSTLLTVAEDGLRPHVDYGLRDHPPALRNEYAVIPVNPARHDVHYRLAMAFVGHLTGPGQSTIESFRVDGSPAFLPVARSETPAFQQYVPRDWPE